MPKANTGRDFEALTGMINHALIGQDATVIRNYKILNKYGIERENDVYIETTNGNIAIECKDWRSKKKQY